MIELYLFRHGESRHNVQPHLVGGLSHEAPLTELGQQQAHWLNERLQHEPAFDHIYASPARRTLETAAIAIPNRHPITSTDLLELGQGSWEGKHRDECYTPEVMERIRENNWTFAAPGGESQQYVAKRMMRFVHDHVMSQRGRIAVFGHGMAIKCLLKEILQFDKRFAYRTVLDNTSITQLSYDGDWMLRRINDIGHVKEYRPALPRGPE